MLRSPPMSSTPRWYVNIKSVEWETPPPVAAGSRVAFMAQFLGRRLAYTYEVREHLPAERFVMSTREGPFPMETTHSWTDTAEGGTRQCRFATLANRRGSATWRRP